MQSHLWLWLSLALIVVLVIVIWSIRRHRSPILRVQSESSFDKLVPSISGLTLGTSVEGNSVEVLENGAFFDVLLPAPVAALQPQAIA